ncbi:hypothetical protein HDU86_003024 [Geranomyces michiganensis]|nr:hypothetical protein HDU86_003024 [Geranomyces michiganensis]
MHLSLNEGISLAAGALPSLFMLIALLTHAVREHRKTLPGGIYLPVSDETTESENNVESADHGAHRRTAKSGRLVLIDILITLLVLMKLALQCVRIVRDVQESDEVSASTVVLGLQAFGWAIASFIAFKVARSYPAKPSRLHSSTFYFYALSAAAEFYLYHRLHVEHAHHTAVAFAQVALLVTGSLFVLEVFQMYRMDSYGVDAMTGPGRPYWKEANASVFSKMFFFWLDSFIRKGARQSLEAEDLWDLQETDRSAHINANFKDIRKAYPQRSLFRDLISCVKWLLACQLTCGALYSFLSLSGPFFLNLLIGWVADPDRVTTTGWLLLFGMTFTGIARAIIAGQMYYIGRRASLRIRGVVVEEVYTKALRRATSNGPRKNGEGEANPDASAGKIVTMMSVDAERLASYVSYAQRLTVEAPLSLILSMSALFYTVGWSAMAGVIVMALSGPFGGLVGKFIARVEDELMTYTDKRVDTANEVLQGIRIIKYFGWEPQFIQRVMAARAKELGTTRKLAFCFVGFHATTSFTALLTSFTTFVVYTTVAGRSLTPQTAFTAVALLAQVSQMLQFLPFLMMEVTQVKVSYDRVANFLLGKELEKYSPSESRAETSCASSGLDSDTDTVGEIPLVGFTHATFTYFGNDDGATATTDAPVVEKKVDEAVIDIADPAAEADADADNAAAAAAATEPVNSEFMLRDVDLTFPIGGLCVVAGPTGSGKSSLLLALLGEMKRVSGSQHLPDPRKPVLNPATGLHSGVAYVAQTPWLIHATIRDNILFGCPYDAKRYQKVVEACALIRDFQTLPGGDLTEIGEKGVNVSGGQKARISLARAAYSRASVIILDDVLAAVDAPTARHLLRECLVGWMSDRTRIVVSHAVGLLVPCADFVVCLKDGVVAAQGTPSRIVENENADGLYGMSLDNVLDENKESEIEEAAGAVDGPAAASKQGEGTKLVDEEERATGSVKLAIYWAYMKAAGGVPFLIIFVLSMIMVNTATLALDWWLKKWTDSAPDTAISALSMGGSERNAALWGSGFNAFLVPVFRTAASYAPRMMMASGDIPPTTPMPPAIPPSPNHTVNYYITIYAILGIISIFFSVIQALFLVIRAVGAAGNLHKQLFEKIMGAPLRFFETTPLGRIVNRLSKDVKFLDQECVWAFESFVSQVFKGIYTLGLITYVSPPFIGGIIPIAAIYISIARQYLKTSREMKRLESVSRSPLYSQFSETLTGATTIRAFGAEERLLMQQRDKVDANHRAYFLLWAANRWLCLRTDLIGVFIALCAGVAVVVGDIGPGWAGLAITYALNLSESLLWTVRMHAEMEMSMNSVERILEYTAIEQEPAAIIDTNRPAPDWPTKAKVEVRDLTIRYSPELPAVLKNLNFTIEGGHKVGVVGRTGAGKSTLSLAFFRILPFSEGTITVDGVDISTFGVRDVRSRFTIIPQDPVLFTGTLRSNLDPFGEHSDETLWEALGAVHVLDGLTRNFSNSESDSNAATTTTTTTTGSARTASGDEAGNSSASDAGSCTTVTPSAVGSRPPLAAVDAATAAPPPTTSVSSPPQLTTAVLDLPVSENGNNFSSGQRQLLCLARALLRRTRLIFLDEATASVDVALDAKIQQTMREQFRDSTVLTIAHRLRTVMDYDRILVLDKGTVEEYGTPYDLARKEGGIFQSMVAETGEVSELLEIARVAQEGRERRLMD